MTKKRLFDWKAAGMVILLTVGGIFFLSLPPTPVPVVRAATITVESTSGGTGGPDCTLRDAITAANTNMATGGCPAGSGADTIVLPGGETITLTVTDNTISGANGLPSITSQITINGNGATIERSGDCDRDRDAEAGEFRIFHVPGGGDLTLKDVTVSNGCADADKPNPPANSGGGLYVAPEGTATIEHCTFCGNGAAGLGGAIFKDGSGTLDISDSTFTSNNAGGGGAIANEGGTVNMTDCTVSNNSALPLGVGGGLYDDLGGTMNLNNITLSNNSAFDGGGIHTNFSPSLQNTITIFNSTISNNTSTDDGGGIENISGTITVVRSTLWKNSTTNDGGAILNVSGQTVRIVNSTLSENSAARGGGLWNNGTATITSSTLWNNSTSPGNGGGIMNFAGASTINIKNSIVGSSPTGGDCSIAATSTFNTSGANFDTDGTCTSFLHAMTSELNLGPLQANGGSTDTHALLTGSVALDAVPMGQCTFDDDGNSDTPEVPLTEDQRGEGRPKGAACDVGAYEAEMRFTPGSITIIKKSVPTDAQDFAFSGSLGNFSLDDDNDPTLPNTLTFTSLVPGRYVVTEADLPDWSLTSLTCTDPDSGTTINLNTRTATIDLDPGETITCTFTNTRKAADVAIRKTGPAVAVAGARVTYTLQVTNAGPANATNVTVTDPLPARVTFVSASGSGWTCSQQGGIVTCTRSSLSVGAAPAISLTVRAPALGDSLRNVATVSSATTDPDTTNNTSAVETQLTRATHIAVAFAFRPEKAEPLTQAGTANQQGLLLLDSANNQVKVMLGNGNGTFKLGQVILVGQGPRAIAVGDFDKDGNNDAITANLGSSDLSILMGNGDGTFNRRTRTIAVGPKPQAVAVGDFDQDGRMDVAVARLGDNAMQLFKGRGDGTFAAGRTYLVAKGPSAIVAADVNQDGALDVAVANADANSVTLWLGQGDGTFSPGGDFLVGTNPVAIASGDFDGDGRVELVTANFTPSDLTILKNQSEPGSRGLQQFRVMKTLSAGEGPVAIVAGQFLKGSLGIACANLVSGSVWVYLRTDSEAMKTVQRYAVMSLPGSLAIADHDGDGKLDLSVLDVAGTSLQVLLDDGRGRFKLATR